MVASVMQFPLIDKVAPCGSQPLAPPSRIAVMESATDDDDVNVDKECGADESLMFLGYLKLYLRGDGKIQIAKVMSLVSWILTNANRRS